MARAVWLVLAVLPLAGCQRVLGLHELPPISAPDAPPPPPRVWTHVATGGAHSCAIAADGSLWCWGDNSDDQLGLGPGAPSEVATPTQVTTPAGATWTAISVAAHASCGLLSDGSLWCWGGNDDGEVGNGTTQPVPQPVEINAGPWSAVSTGATHTCAILAAGGSTRCWGYNGHGELGVGDTTNRTTPTQLAGATHFQAIAAGGEHTCGISAPDGALWCWGDRFYGALWLGPQAGSITAPMQANATGWKTITAGDDFTCGIDVLGELWCWGANGYDQLAAGVPTATSEPFKIGADGEWDDVAAGATSTCATSQGQLWCWGNNTMAQAGVGSITPVLDTQTEIATAQAPWAAVAPGAYHTCAIDQAGQLWCFGDGARGMLGNGVTSATLPVELDQSWRAASAHGDSTCALGVNGAIACWGDDGAYQLGDGQRQPRATPEQLANTGPWSQVAVGDTHACARTTGAAPELWCWGVNDDGEIGNGTMTSQRTPIAVVSSTTSPTSAQAAVTGMAHTCVLDGTGAPWCWGRNNFGEVGDGTTTDRAVPQHVVLARASTAIAAGQEHTCALLSDIASSNQSQLQCWGDNMSGQLGDDGNEMAASKPVTIALPPLLTIAAGGYSTCAIDVTNVGYCWGANGHGELGTGDTSQANTPKPLVGSHKLVEIAPAIDHTCAIGTNQTLWCWGSNAHGQLGDGTLLDQLAPEQIAKTTSWKHVTTGAHHTCAVSTDDHLWCWGDDLDGQLGTGAPWSAAPVAVP